MNKCIDGLSIDFHRIALRNTVASYFHGIYFDLFTYFRNDL